MNRIWSWAWVLLLLPLNAMAQEGLISIQPSGASGDDEITLIYDASLGETALIGAEKVYMHSGVITEGPDGTSWQYVVGNWGQDDGVGEMTKVDGEENKWQITLSPSARAYYSVPEGETIFRLAMVFRNANGSSEGKGTPGTYGWGQVAGNNDIFVTLTTGSFVQITAPANEELFVPSTETVTFSAEASSEVTSMTLSMDEGSGFSEVASVNSGTDISYEYTPVSSGTVVVRVSAIIDGETVESERTYTINVIPVTNEAPLPDGAVKGINYVDANSVILVLEAPFKEFVYVVGDFNNWEVRNDYLMNKAPGTDLFWLEVNGLTAGQKYVFQYWVDGTIRIGDPYADEVADADDDPFISSAVHPNIAPYDKPYGPASVLQTNQQPFNWAASEGTWTPPPADNLIVYELLLRDFLGSHSYDDLIDTLDYLDRLGVNAIELMPVMEFEGNISWGYNPSYFFAVDKYYGTKNDFKRFVQAAHQRGIAVIMDMVLNHAFGESPLVRMYINNGVPTPESPWFNQQARHPFNVGYDFNHESQYTKDFVDSVNHYWMSEYHVDGYRFDLSKGFTQTNNPDDVGAWSAYDASRVAILKRMAEAMRDDYPESYVILEHFADNTEETELAANNMLLWRNMNFPYHEALAGFPGDFSGAAAKTHVSYMESHDEERALFEAYLKGTSLGYYSTTDTTILLERAKMAAAFFFTLPGPKMLWQFGELGYDVELNDDRLAPKPLPWGNGGLGYYTDEERGYLYDVYAAILNLKKQYGEEWNDASYSYDFNGNFRGIEIDAASVDFTIVGNFGLTEESQDVSFTSSGTWYDFFSDATITVDGTSEMLTLQPGEFHIYTSQDLGGSYENVVEVFQVPIAINPMPFTKDDPITIRFDASRANPDGTAGLVGASEVFLVSGTVVEPGAGRQLTNVVDGAAGQMTLVDGETDIWEITLTPSDYFGVTGETDIYRLGMYFRDGSGNLGKGFRGETIFVNVLIDGNMVEITPAQFSQTDEITLTFDARFGSGNLLGANKVYMHSGVVLSDLEQPTGSDWSRVRGNWGQDDGVGEMSPVSGQPNLWTITLRPGEYYGLTGSQQAWWLAMVFRNADGSKQAGGTEDMTIDNGYVAPNGDIFMRVTSIDEVVSIEDEFGDEQFRYYPNPVRGILTLETFEGSGGQAEVITLSGKTVLTHDLKPDSNEIDVSRLSEGLYLIRLTTPQGEVMMGRVVVRK